MAQKIGAKKKKLLGVGEEKGKETLQRSEELMSVLVILVLESGYLAM